MSPFQLKFPPAYDTSSHVSKDGLTKPMAELRPRPWAIIGRAVVARYWAGMRYATYDVEPDPSLGPLFAAARAAQVPFTAYAYMLQGKMQKQIDKFVEHCTDVGLISGGRWQGGLPPIADVEVDVPVPPKKRPKNYIEPLSGAAWAAEIHKWLLAIEQAAGVRPAIYTAQPQWAELLSNGRPPAWTGDYLFWLKFYPYSRYVDQVLTFPASALPAGVKMEQVFLWQYHEKGRANGYDYNDLNVPTEVGLKVFGNGGPVPTPEPDPLPAPELAWVITEQSAKRIVMELK